MQASKGTTAADPLSLFLHNVLRVRIPCGAVSTSRPKMHLDQKIHAVTIYSALGIKIAQFFPSSKDICYSLSALPKGLYLVRVFTEKNVTTEKVFKNN